MNDVGGAPSRLKPDRLRWSVAIIACRESEEVLARCLQSVVLACGETPSRIDLLVNGNPALADEASALADSLSLPRGLEVYIWRIDFGDKANAWNVYVHHLWPNAETAFFVDGYAEIAPRAFCLLHEGMQEHPDTLGATGLPASGPSAQALSRETLNEGGFHGGLNALRGTTMREIRRRVVRLPLGLYRTDSVIGAFLAFAVDPARHSWNLRRIYVHPDAEFTVATAPRWRPHYLVSQVKRRFRQAQGVLENRAVQEHLQVNKRSPESLPRTVDQLVTDWMEARPREWRRLLMRQPLALYAARKLGQDRRWSEADKPPVLVGRCTFDSARS